MFKKMKMRINNPDHSKAVQEWLFNQGFQWDAFGKRHSHTTLPYLLTYPEGDIRFEYSLDEFNQDKSPEINVSHLDPHLQNKPSPTITIDMQQLYDAADFIWLDNPHNVVKDRKEAISLIRSLITKVLVENLECISTAGVTVMKQMEDEDYYMINILVDPSIDKPHMFVSQSLEAMIESMEE